MAQHVPVVDAFELPLKVSHVDCTINKQFVYNGLFGAMHPDKLFAMQEHHENFGIESLIKSHTTRDSVLYLLETGNKHAISIVFAHKERLRAQSRRYYSTLFGPIFWGPWTVYRGSRGNFDRAFTRMAACRIPEGVTDEAEIREYEDNLRRNNRDIFSARSKLRPIIKGLLGPIRDRITSVMSQVDDLIKTQVEYAHAKHPKKKLRMAAVTEIIERCEFGGLFTKKITGKVKLYEKAKPGKYPRLIGDYTCPGSLLGGFLCEIIKSSFHEIVMHNKQARFLFVNSVEPEVLDAAVSRLFDGNKEFFGIFFSDDSLMRLGGKVFEMDISSCDMSNSSSIFGVLRWLASGTTIGDNVMRRNVHQCQLPLVVPDPDNASPPIKIFPTEPLEFSGSTLTTCLNNIATFIIMLSCVLSDAKDAESIKAAARAVGYDVTVAERSTPPQCQFLKHSFYVDENGKMNSFLNLGAMLRSFGSCDRDNCRDPKAWNSSVLKGYMHSGRSSIQRALEMKYMFKDVSCRLPIDITKHFSLGRREDVPNWVLCERYGISGDQISEICQAILAPGNVINTLALQQIYKVDYGL